MWLEPDPYISRGSDTDPYLISVLLEVNPDSYFFVRVDYGSSRF